MRMFMCAGNTGSSCPSALLLGLVACRSKEELPLVAPMHAAAPPDSLIVWTKIRSKVGIKGLRRTLRWAACVGALVADVTDPDPAAGAAAPDAGATGSALALGEIAGATAGVAAPDLEDRQIDFHIRFSEAGVHDYAEMMYDQVCRMSDVMHWARARGVHDAAGVEDGRPA